MLLRISFVGNGGQISWDVSLKHYPRLVYSPAFELASSIDYESADREVPSDLTFVENV
jgi:hypothetical protein